MNVPPPPAQGPPEPAQGPPEPAQGPPEPAQGPPAPPEGPLAIVSLDDQKTALLTGGLATVQELISNLSQRELGAVLVNNGADFGVPAQAGSCKTNRNL